MISLRFNLTYLYQPLFLVDDCKLAINWNALGIEKTTGGNISGEQDAVHRTYIFTLAYLGLYAGLIFTSLYSLSGIRNSCCGRRSFVIFFVPWILVCTAIVIMDLLATTYYIMDSIATVVRTKLIHKFISVVEIRIFFN